MKIYLDIDGTLLHEDIERLGEPADGLAEFIIALRPYDVYWLTTHCMDGDPQHARKMLKAVLPIELHGDIDRIKPTTWSTLKTDAIDFSDKFIWFDNDVLVSEREVLRKKALRDQQWLVEIDLVANPHNLFDTLRDSLH